MYTCNNLQGTVIRKMADREQVLIVPDEIGGGGFPLPVTAGTGFDAGGGSFGGGLLGLLLPLILLASILPGLIPPATTPAPTPAPACPVCAAPITCTTPAPCVPTPDCPDGFMKLMNGATTIPNKCYMFLTTAKTFITQLQRCTIKGGTLANPMTEDEGQAIRTYLKTNHPGVEFYLGYTDLENNEDQIALSGGPINPIPGLGVNAEENDGTGDDCTTVEVSNANAVTADTPGCDSAENAVCEVNLSNQKCVCP